MYRKPPSKEPSPSTKLVQQLYSFGLDDVQEDPSSSSSPPPPTTTSLEPEASTSTLAPPLITTKLSNLSLPPPVPSSSSSSSKKEQKKDSKLSSVRKLLKSTDHVIKLPKQQQGEGEGEGEGEIELEERVLTSWKMADYAYKREPCPFPTRARGLFTEKIKGSSEEGEGEEEEEYRIVARGYDKFFNVNEVSWTQWEKIPEYSTGPYELTLKSNGCIILISSITPKDLIVTSKHSIGKNQNLSTEGSISHSERGEYWLSKHLKSVSKTKQELAKELWENNLTAVAELCDDSFEEHVLPYPKEQTGLHLHGLNLNLPNLKTLPSLKVSQFAKKYGFISTKFFIFPSVVAVKTYCETVQQQGGIEFDDDGSGKITPVEGFVVRGKKRGGEEGEAFFWKVKYDEPYLMYREWRELTRKSLNAYNPTTGLVEGIDHKKIKNPDSRLYLWWVKKQIETNYSNFESWKFGKGMIKTRQDFLEWEKTVQGRQTRRELGEIVELDEEEKKNRKFDKTILVPIAIQGCGKTAIGLELSRLFPGWAHVQSDDFLVKKPAPHFIRKIKELLKDHDVVYADKNNHQIKHRKDLLDLTQSLSSQYRIRLVALVYPIDSPTLPRDKFHSLMSSRIVSRGSNHQSLRAGELHESIIWQFLGQHEPFDQVGNANIDGKFDFNFEIKPEWNQLEALKFVVDQLKGIEGLGITEEMLQEERLIEAVQSAKDYKVEIKKSIPEDSTTAIKKRQQQQSLRPRYYGLLVDVNLRELVEKHLPLEIKTDESSIWNQLVRASRVETKPHVTLVHQIELQSTDPILKQEKQTLWNKYEKLIEKAQNESETEKLLQVELTLGPRLVWNDRAISIEVSALHQPRPQSATPPNSLNSTAATLEEEEGGKISLVSDRSAHITVGTRSSDIRPIEGKFLMEKALKGEETAEEIREIRIGEIRVKARLAGLS
ncbi:hypothetical protein JCM3765_001389 [Sporobolomyces pararoseus]